MAELIRAKSTQRSGVWLAGGTGGLSTRETVNSSARDKPHSGKYTSTISENILSGH